MSGADDYLHDPTEPAHAGEGPTDAREDERDDAGARRATGTFDVEALSRALLASDDAGSYLARWLEGHGGAQGGGALEAFLARSLGEAGIGADGRGLPSLRAVRPTTSGLFYLRTEEPRAPYASYLRTISAEAALNGVLLAEGLLRGRESFDLDDVYRALQTAEARVAAQAQRPAMPVLPRPTDAFDLLARPADDGEWAARLAVSRDIECLRLPWRLVARFRVNRAAGEAAAVFDVTPAACMRGSAFVEGAGVVPTTLDMRRRAASAYALRVALLLARRILDDCPEVGRVWVAGTRDTPSRHLCHLSATLARDELEQVDLGRDFDPFVLCRSLGVRMSLEDGVLRDVEQGFSLDEARFCPPERYGAHGMAGRALDPTSTRLLGTKAGDGLAIEEDAGRRRLADRVVRAVPEGARGRSCEACVRALWGSVGDETDPSVLAAARRTARRLVSGELEPDALAVAEDFVEGGELPGALRRAGALVAAGRTDEAAAELEAALARVDGAGAYRDHDDVEWRSFGSYADRVLYNRLLARAGATCRLVPRAYREARESLSTLRLAQGDASAATAHARRAVALSPTDTRARLRLVRCLEEAGEGDEAREQLRLALTWAHDPQGIGRAYFREACLLLDDGSPEAARACYQRSLVYLPGELLVPGGLAEALAAMGLEALEPLDDEAAEDALSKAGVPLAPTFAVSRALLEGSRAALDDELFPVARDLLREVCALTRDDMLLGVLLSLEGEPDR